MTVFQRIGKGTGINWNMGAGKPLLVLNVLFALYHFALEEFECHKGLVMFNNNMKKQGYSFNKRPEEMLLRKGSLIIFLQKKWRLVEEEGVLKHRFLLFRLFIALSDF